MALKLTPEQEARRQQLLAGVVLFNDKPPVDHERRAAEFAAKKERALMAADDAVARVKDLQRRGFKVFPIKEGAKFPPLIKDWPRLATDDEALAGMWADQPRNNIGIHCEGLLVVDVDVRSDGDNSLAGLQMIEDLDIGTLTTRTPTGGRHLFYRLPAGHPGVTNGAGKLGPGLDVKSNRGYVVAPGSRVEAGEYKIERDLPILDAPDWLVQRCGVYTERGPAPKVDIPDAHDMLVERAREWIKSQPRGDEAYKTACGLQNRGLSEAQALEVLAEHDGRDPALLAEKVAHAYRYAKGAPGSKVATLDDFEVVEEVAPPAPAKARGPGPQSLDDFASPTAGSPYLVKGLLSQRSYAVIYGPPGEGKTFTALDLGRHVAAGRPWMGRKVHQGLVLYLAFEGAGGLRARAQALKQHYQDRKLPLYFDSTQYNLRELEGRKALGETIRGLPSAPKMIVIDTLAHALCGADENSAQDMSAFNSGVQALIEATGACVVVIHHPPKNGTGPRGSGALHGAIDTMIEVSARRITPLKQRDVEICAPIAFKLQPVPIGMDEDNEIITSCVVLESKFDGLVPDAKLKSDGGAALAYDMLKEIRPQNDPVTNLEWKQACAEFVGPARTAWPKITNKLQKARLVVKTEAGLWMRRME